MAAISSPRSSISPMMRIWSCGWIVYRKGMSWRSRSVDPGGLAIGSGDHPATLVWSSSRAWEMISSRASGRSASARLSLATHPAKPCAAQARPSPGIDAYGPVVIVC